MSPEKKTRVGFLRKGIGLSRTQPLTPWAEEEKARGVENKRIRELKNAIKSKTLKKCEDCRFWNSEATEVYPKGHCGLYSVDCTSKISRPRFMTKDGEYKP
jgi:hypothetical protein